MTQTIRIATRKSPLALWQAEYVKAELQKNHPGLQVELLGMSTKGDKILDSPLAKIGGKGLFVKELEVAILEDRADIAVHSMKDVPHDFPEGLGLVTICEREEPRDAFVSNQFKNLDELPKGAKVGTSSLRRQCQLMALRPDLKVLQLRGNVNTRLKKLDEGQYDAIILAAAGLLRLEMPERIASLIPVEQSLPAAGQGAVGIECRLDDQTTRDILAPLHHQETALRVTAERAVNHRLNGGCQVPIGAFAELVDGQLQLNGLVGDPDGSVIYRSESTGKTEQALEQGQLLAEQLLEQGAGEILAKLLKDE